METNRQVAKMSSIMIIIAVAGGLLTVLREALIAKYFGLSSAVDAFYISSVFPEIVIGIITTTFASVFVPVFCRINSEKGPAGANRAISNTVAVFLAVSCAAALAYYAFNGLFLQLFFSKIDAGTALVAARLSRIMALYIPLGAAVGLLANIHYSKDNFVLGSASAYAVTLITIAMLVWFAGVSGVIVLPAALLIGTGVQLAVLFLYDKERYEYFKKDIACFAETASNFRNMALFFAAISISAFGPAIDRMMASWLIPGSVACLAYANKLVVFPINLVANSIVTVLFPYFAAQAARDEKAAMIDSLTKSLRVAAMLLIPLTIMLILTSDSLITLLYKHGRFDNAAKDMMVSVFNCYSLQLYFYTASLIMIRAMLALREIKMLLILTLVSFACNVAFNLIFMQFLNPKVAGIALSTSLVHLQGALFLFIVLRKRFLGQFGGGLKASFGHAAACSIISGALVYALITVSDGCCAGNIGQAARLAAIFGAWGISVILYYTKVARVNEFTVFLGLIKERLFGGKQL